MSSIRQLLAPFAPLVLLAVACATPLALALEQGTSPGTTPGLAPGQLASLRTVRSAELSPDGELVAYTVRVPRIPGVGEDGGAWSELHVVPFHGGPSRAFVAGEVSVSSVSFTPDGQWITYLARRGGDEHTALWAIPVDGGESHQVFTFEEGVSSYRISPDQTRLAFIASEPDRESREKAQKQGFSQIVFEEDWRPSRVWVAALPPLAPEPPQPWDGEIGGEEPVDPGAPRALEILECVLDVEWGPQGEWLVVTGAPSPSIDDSYMHRRLRVVDADSGLVRGWIKNPGKLGHFEMSPDGDNVAMVSAADYADPADGRMMIAPVADGPPRDLLPGLEGHVRSFAWVDAKTVCLTISVGVGSIFGDLDIETGTFRELFAGGRFEDAEDGPSSPVLGGPSLSKDGSRVAFVGESALHPGEVFVMERVNGAPRRLTNTNPWLEDVTLARQEVIRHEARDGLELEGILIHPLDGATPAPLILVVHGGPESNMRNGWLTSQTRLGQLAAARGYAVFHPNYRGSTGRGVAFAKSSQGDAAGAEFDDLIDAADHLIEIGVADRERVGVCGGSYGGYATAWLSTYYSERIRAGVMTVGISNVLNKGLTTNIPVEDRVVHMLRQPWEDWQFRLERSPVFHAEKSRTALLIAGGDADPRVNPEQSLQLYRALKMLGKTPVRYVQYRGEGHGNRRAASRHDLCLRMLRWFDHFLKGDGTALPPWDLKLGEPAADTPRGF